MEMVAASIRRAAKGITEAVRNWTSGAAEAVSTDTAVDLQAALRQGKIDAAYRVLRDSGDPQSPGEMLGSWDSVLPRNVQQERFNDTMQRALKLQQKGQWLKALVCLSIAAEQASSNVEGRYFKALVALELNNNQMAREIALSAIERSEICWGLYLVLAIAEERLNNHAAADRNYRRAHLTAPHILIVQSYYARWQAKRGNRDEAISALRCLQQQLTEEEVCDTTEPYRTESVGSDWDSMTCHSLQDLTAGLEFLSNAGFRADQTLEGVSFLLNLAQETIVDLRSAASTV